MKLYCLCKLPHDGERPMLQCDACRDWFHWDCVGLTPPGDDEDDEEVAPADFQCPACCVKVRILGSSALVHAVGGTRKPWQQCAGCPQPPLHTRRAATARATCKLLWERSQDDC